MNKIVLIVFVVIIVFFGMFRSADAHCEVPCGIFADQMRFEAMLEDTTTIRKAMVQISELAGKSDAQSAH